MLCGTNDFGPLVDEYVRAEDAEKLEAELAAYKKELSQANGTEIDLQLKLSDALREKADAEHALNACREGEIDLNRRKKKSGENQNPYTPEFCDDGCVYAVDGACRAQPGECQDDWLRARKLEAALIEVMRFNHIRNDREAYLYSLSEWALGIVDKKPSPEDYGLKEEA